MAWVELKYVSVISARLRNYTVKGRSPFIANFSCPFCGDSQKSTKKARGYFYTKANKINMMCHNCGKSCSFGTFLKEFAPDEFKNYIFEKFKEDNLYNRKEVQSEEKVDEPLVQESSKDIFLGIPIKDLTESSAAIKYLRGRRIPEDRYAELFYVDNFGKLAESFPKYDFENLPKDQRIIFPVRNRRGDLVGISARAISNTKLRYVILKILDEPMIYNLDKIDIGKPVIAVEGAIDSMFLPNAVAADGADFAKIVEIIPRTSLTIAMDNEPRNREIVNKMRDICDMNIPLVIWPKWIKVYGKDINEMIKNGLTNEKIIRTINESTRTGLQCKLSLASWKGSL